jgi:ribosome biogenesis GTPase / thiamine phosphate phosphatase
VKRAVRGETIAFSARVIATYGRTSMLEGEHGELWSAVRRGRKSDVVVGDQVTATASAEGQAAIESIAQRSSLLYRADAFRIKELAANVDQVIVVFASRPSFNLWFIWKALLAASAAGIDATVVRNKTDLAEGAETAQAALDDIRALGWRTLAISVRGDATEAIAQLTPLLHEHRSLLIGQSGMGKSTLLNLLVPDAQARTREFSERLDQGKQTTTAARWFDLPGGGALIDTPGFQEFGLAHLTASDVVAGFPEFAPHLGRCRFLDCRHLVEPECAIRRALESGQIAPGRYDFYRSLAETRTR